MKFLHSIYEQSPLQASNISPIKFQKDAVYLVNINKGLGSNLLDFPLG